jgi:hypothetical protein
MSVNQLLPMHWNIHARGVRMVVVDSNMPGDLLEKFTSVVGVGASFTAYYSVRVGVVEGVVEVAR